MSIIEATILVVHHVVLADGAGIFAEEPSVDALLVELVEAREQLDDLFPLEILHADCAIVLKFFTAF